MNLIFDTDSQSELNVVENINESTGQKQKEYHIKGIFSTIGEKNRNGRIYPRNLWEQQIAAYQNNFTNGTINTLMEYDHPARTAVDPMKAVAKINSLKIEGNYVMGDAVLLDNPQANQLKTLIDHGVKISVSSRGVGSVKNGIVDNFKLITYDIVPDPSDYNATMNGVCESYQLNEGIVKDLEITEDNGNFIETKVNPEPEFSTEDMQNAIKQKFADFISNL